MRCRYNTVDFHPNPHKRHSIAHPRGRGVFLWVEPLSSGPVAAVLYTICSFVRSRYNGPSAVCISMIKKFSRQGNALRIIGLCLLKFFLLARTTFWLGCRWLETPRRPCDIIVIMRWCQDWMLRTFVTDTPIKRIPMITIYQDSNISLQSCRQHFMNNSTVSAQFFFSR